MRIIGSFVLAIIAALVVDCFMPQTVIQVLPPPQPNSLSEATPLTSPVSRETEAPATKPIESPAPPAPRTARGCTTKLCLMFLNAEKQGKVVLHIKYNTLTNGHSKIILRESGEKIYILQGKDYSPYYGTLRCRVSKDLFDSVSENSHIDIPVKLCEEIKP